MNPQKTTPLELGGEYELANVDIRYSTATARDTLLGLIPRRRPAVIEDLLRIHNSEALNSIQGEDQSIADFWYWFFILNLSDQWYFDIELSQFDIVATVRDTPLQLYSNYLRKKQNEITELEKIIKRRREEYGLMDFEVVSSKILYSEALSELVPNWSALKSDKDAENLSKALIDWSNRWNLTEGTVYTEDWCLNFALKVLAEFLLKIQGIFLPHKYDLKTEPDDKSFIIWELRRSGLQRDSWQRAISRRRFMVTDHIDILFDDDEAKNAPKDFTFLINLKENSKNIIPQIKDRWYGVITKAEEFRERVISQFWNAFYILLQKNMSDFAGNEKKVSGVISDFRTQLDIYISDAHTYYQTASVIGEDGTKKNKYIKTPSKTSGYLHFDWLIDYQIPDALGRVKTFAEIGERKTVGKAVNELCMLLNLQQRAGSPPGKKRGSKDRTHTYRR